MNNATKHKLLDELFTLFLDSKYQPEDRSLFKEWHMDIDTILKNNMALFRQLKTRAKAELNRTKYERVTAFLAKFKQGIESRQEEYIKLADRILTKPKFAELQPLFKNLTSLSSRDKQGIVIDTKLLDLLGEIAEEYDSDSNGK
ncbi:MAG: hypothetical protein ABSF91_08225 [Bacteroidota bacterium]|jgi:hypothetical protein